MLYSSNSAGARLISVMPCLAGTGAGEGGADTISHTDHYLSTTRWAGQGRGTSLVLKVSSEAEPVPCCRQADLLQVLWKVCSHLPEEASGSGGEQQLEARVMREEQCWLPWSPYSVGPAMKLGQASLEKMAWSDSQSS